MAPLADAKCPRRGAQVAARCMRRSSGGTPWLTPVAIGTRRAMRAPVVPESTVIRRPRRARPQWASPAFARTGGAIRRSVQAMPMAERMNTVWITVCQTTPAVVVLVQYLDTTAPTF